jgi:hypothetical protein
MRRRFYMGAAKVNSSVASIGHAGVKVDCRSPLEVFEKHVNPLKADYTWTNGRPPSHLKWILISCFSGVQNVAVVPEKHRGNNYGTPASQG